MTSIETTGITREQTRKVITISQYDRIIDAADLMHKNHIGCLVVTENSKDDTMVGIITERDILAWLPDASPATYFQQINVVMTRDISSCRPGASVNDAIEQMTQQRIRHMPIVEDGKAVGIISMRDLLEQRQFHSPSERI